MSEDHVPLGVFRSFLAVNRRLAGEADLGRAMSFLLDTAVTLTGGRYGYLLVGRPDGLRLEFKSGESTDDAVRYSRSMVNRALQTRQALTGDDARADRALIDMPSVRELDRRSAICVPFASAGGVEGAIYVEHPGRPGAFGEAEKGYLDILADQAAIAVDRMLHEERIARELEKSQRELQVVRRTLGARGKARMLGDSKPMRVLRDQIARLAAADLPVLIVGETGVGKELVARALHEQSARARGNFVSENCSAIPAELMESELFGHRKGAFTGADEDRPGLLEIASGGTVFLDEVGDMPLELQAKLLRALQEQQVRRVGDSAPLPIDIRVVAATHKDLRAMIAEGTFREDLYFRLAAADLRVPPLRERGNDIVLLAEEFLARLNKRHRRDLRLGEAALERLRRYEWPGNVRELEHVISRAFILSDKAVLDAEHLPSAGSSRTAVSSWPAISLAEAEARTIRAALKSVGGEKTKAAKLLCISRTALYEKLKRMQRQGM